MNLTQLSVLVADANDVYRDILRRIFFGFGARRVLDVADEESARQALLMRRPDLFVCDVNLPGCGAHSLIRSVRMDPSHKRRAIPMLVVMGVASASSVREARDAGANMVLRKPISPKMVYDRLAWLAHNPRQFFSSTSYFGPDRRMGGPTDTPHLRRRSTDVTEAGIDETFNVNAGSTSS